MDTLVLFRTFGALTLLLGLLSGALWAVRRFDIRLPGAVTRQPDRRLELVERLGLDQRRSAVLIRRDDREHLLIISPEGQLLVETLEARPTKAPPPQPERAARPLPESFTALLNHKLAMPGSTSSHRAKPGSKRKN
ncbi:flagellar biosynthetic protein FliO [Citromicrobium bathyomarinum]|jgi:flagellar protein FliO/FliZ|uniref:flagellar biosynthetic protein FliO n=1 Tax=Citromicrobium bathyomarinum TaxID=72174 RepID=UPI001E5F44C6|nr:flagellar biosynthetic protein FliO [Citromicrobium bathyomarinum]MCD1623212.1 flagellar biosynthetic protein FliO [Citromicrobium bathyomarinum]